jgi:hypothetical protein
VRVVQVGQGFDFASVGVLGGVDLPKPRLGRAAVGVRHMTVTHLPAADCGANTPLAAPPRLPVPVCVAGFPRQADS